MKLQYSYVWLCVLQFMHTIGMKKHAMMSCHFGILNPWLILVICSLDTGLWLILFSNANVLFSIL